MLSLDYSILGLAKTKGGDIDLPKIRSHRAINSHVPLYQSGSSAKATHFTLLAQVDSAWYRGDVEAARRNSKVAQICNIATIITGATLTVVIPVTVVTAIAASQSAGVQ